MASHRVHVISSKGCTKLFAGVSRSFSSLNSPRPSDLMSHTSKASTVTSACLTSNGPFTGLVICVTGLSKEARKQVMKATERLGGHYSSSLHPQCTHLVVQSLGGRKFEHGMKHGVKNGFHVVTLGWFVDSVKRNVRLNESLYNIKSAGDISLPLAELKHFPEYAYAERSCLHPFMSEENRLSHSTWQSHMQSSAKDSRTSRGSVLGNDCIYIDTNISIELKKKVVDALTGEGTKLLDHWFAGCHATHVVCEGPHIQHYVGRTNNLVTPLWILKTLKAKHTQRLVHLSTDLARQVAAILENAQTINGSHKNEITVTSGEPLICKKGKGSIEDKLKIVDLAKMGVRDRRRLRMQSCQTPLRPITPSSLLDSICWSISEPTSSACVYTDFSGTEDASEQTASELLNSQADRSVLEASFENFSRPLRESEKNNVIFKGHFLTILFPIDRFGELGPSSKTFFSSSGFTCLQVLDHIYKFYQENMSADEVSVAIHTDSRHGDRLRSVYASQESIDHGIVSFKRIDFLGSRRSFEVLKRVSGENNNSVYELLIRA